MSKLSDKYVDLVERWLYGGVNIQSMAMTPSQKYRAMVVYEAYQRWLQDKQIRPLDLMRKLSAREYPVLLMRADNGDAKAQELVDDMRIRPGIGRSLTELSNDVALFNHIVDKFQTPIDAIEKAKVVDASDWLIREGMKMGDSRSVKSGADLKMQLYGNFEEKDDPTANQPKSDINITMDVSVIKPDKQNYTPEERRRIARRYGLTDKQVIDLMQNNDGTWQIPGEQPEEDQQPDVFDFQPEKGDGQ